MVDVAIICQDEAETIGWTLECAEKLDDLLGKIVVADSGSTDGTLDILARAWRLPLSVICHPLDRFDEQLNMVLDRCTSEWVLQADADMTWSPSFAAAMRAGEFESADVWWCPLYYTRGSRMHYCPDCLKANPWTLRLFRRGHRFVNPIHQRLITCAGEEPISVGRTQSWCVFENSLLTSDESLLRRGQRYLKWAKESASRCLPVGDVERYIKAKHNPEQPLLIPERYHETPTAQVC